LLHKISKLQFAANWTKTINSYLSNRKFRISVESELSTPSGIESGVPQGSVLVPTVYSLYIINTRRTPRVHIALFVDDTCIYATDSKENYVLTKPQRGLSAMEEW